MTYDTARLMRTHLEFPDEIESRDQLAVTTLNQQRNEHETQHESHHNFQIEHTRVIAAITADSYKRLLKKSFKPAIFFQ